MSWSPSFKPCMHSIFLFISLVSLPVSTSHSVRKFYPTAIYQHNDRLFKNKGSDLGAAPKKGFVQCSCKVSLCSDWKKSRARWGIKSRKQRAAGSCSGAGGRPWDNCFFHFFTCNCCVKWIFVEEGAATANCSGNAVPSPHWFVFTVLLPTENQKQ